MGMANRLPLTAQAALAAGELMMRRALVDEITATLIERIAALTELADLARRERQDVEAYGELTRQLREDERATMRRIGVLIPDTGMSEAAL